LYLEIKVHNHEVFHRSGDDLLATLEVQMTDAVLGTTAIIKGLDGEVSVEIKPGSQSADVVTVKGRGVTHLRGTGRGDLRVCLHVLTPTKLDAAEEQLIQQFAAKRKTPPPKLSHFQQGLFQKLRDRFTGA
ncbi:MAG TPA: DnaJ C-terminal domain-containing protein, partial [Terrimesophilobacter sp.]|nr:DnaJ C-terminal domain-containing protein [Terrimesophilobacter sp.]